jgi:hypothetical protein
MHAKWAVCSSTAASSSLQVVVSVNWLLGFRLQRSAQLQQRVRLVRDNALYSSIQP